MCLLRSSLGSIPTALTSMPKTPSANDSPDPAPAPDGPATDAPGATLVTIFATDVFGAESEVFTFDVVVNRPPSVGQEFLDVVLYRLATGTTAPEARDWTPGTAGGETSKCQVYACELLRRFGPG